MRAGLLAWIVACTLAVMVVNVLVSFVVVWVYSIFVAPGLDDAAYTAFALRSAPVSSVIAGVPLMFVAGFAIARSLAGRAALLAGGAVALLYIVIDAAILLSSEVPAEIWPWAWASYATKLTAATAGAAWRARRSSPGNWEKKT